MAHRLIIGCGYLGARVAKLWCDAGDVVHAVTRRAARAVEFAAVGWTPHVADVTQSNGWNALPQADTVLFAVGHDRHAPASIEEVYAKGVRRVLNALSPSTGRFIYISSTGVYGPADGDWVDEDTPPDPRRPGGAASLAAERQVELGSLAQRSVVLRMAGLYGPGRVPLIDKLRRGETLDAPADGWLNLIHIDDAARVTADAADWSLEGWSQRPLVVCVSDGHPTPRRAYYEAAARWMGVKRPEFASHVEGSHSEARRAAGNRRVCNARLLRLLARDLQYPSYLDGLKSILEEAGY